MQVRYNIVCAYAGKYQGTHLTTFKTYKVLSTQHDHGRDYVSIIDDSGAERTYTTNRFVAQENA